MIEDKDLLSIQEVRTKVEKAYSAWLEYRTFSQERIDAVVERMGAVARANAKRLADMRSKKPATATPRTSTSRICCAPTGCRGACAA